MFIMEVEAVKRKGCAYRVSGKQRPCSIECVIVAVTSAGYTRQNSATPAKVVTLRRVCGDQVEHLFPPAADSRQATVAVEVAKVKCKKSSQDKRQVPSSVTCERDCST